MKKVISTEKIPIKMWLDDCEEGALAQARNLANLPYAFKWISLMPDCHQGYGMPIGGVMATRAAIVPNAVGVDIGCGMQACRTSIKNLDTETIKQIMGFVRKYIPLGFNHHSKKQIWSGFDAAPAGIPECEINNAQYQLGTLGGGNHFIEIQKGSDGFIWIMIHSGSRNLGFKVAKKYHEAAQYLCKNWYSNIPDPDLAFLPMISEIADEYLSAMNFCLDFAAENRYHMMNIIKKIFCEFVANTTFETEIDVHHNYARLESHYGYNVWVHRKGATSARENQIGLIPGSQGTKSYVVKGKGNPESFNSCSHGAGRAMGRADAQRRLVLADEKKRLDDQGIIHGIRNEKDLDEASGAYKDISVVMANQADLVEIVTELQPLAVIKA